MQDRFTTGVEFFNNQRYFDAHEVWEDEWREAADPEKLWLQGLVQTAVGFHHLSKGNRTGACSVISRAIRNLAACPTTLRGIDIARLRNDLDRVQAEIVAAKSVTPFLIRQQKNQAT